MDKNVEEFLKNKALEFDKRNVSRTYLFVEENAFVNGKLMIQAYFTLALKTLFFDSRVSKRMIQKIDGFSKDADCVSAILIGQLGKDLIHGDVLHGSDILFEAMNLAYEIFSTVGCRIVLIECEQIDKLVEFYEINGFTKLQENNKTKLIQMVRFL